jgi:hypothetical protein
VDRNHPDYPPTFPRSWVQCYDSLTSSQKGKAVLPQKSKNQFPLQSLQSTHQISQSLPSSRPQPTKCNPIAKIIAFHPPKVQKSRHNATLFLLQKYPLTFPIKTKSTAKSLIPIPAHLSTLYPLGLGDRLCLVVARLSSVRIYLDCELIFVLGGGKVVLLHCWTDPFVVAFC